MNLKRLTVTKDEDGTALVGFLSGRLRLSRSKAKALINQRDIFVNQQRTWMARHTLKAGDIVEMPDRQNRSDTAKIPILFEDDYYVVANKRPGMLSNEQGSAEEILRSQLNEENLKVVHRLDRDTSGCLLLAKTPEAFEKAVSMFRERSVKKSYHVVVSGRIDWKERTLKTPIEGRKAVTLCRCLDTNRQASHLTAVLETGRTHQIRQHLNAIDHPVVGDRHYGTRSAASSKTMKVGRQMLHASDLRFTHPFTNRRLSVRAPVPKDLRNCLKSFGLT